MDNALKAKRILANNLFMTLATTSSNGLPWSTPVFYAVDNQNNFFWYSGKNTRHSQNIKQNNKVSASIFSAAGDDEGIGVYIEGEAFELGDDELDYATNTYAAKAAGSEAERESLTEIKDFLKDAPLRIYISGEATKWNGKLIDIREEITSVIS